MNSNNVKRTNLSTVLSDTTRFEPGLSSLRVPRMVLSMVLCVVLAMVSCTRCAPQHVHRQPEHAVGLQRGRRERAARADGRQPTDGMAQGTDAGVDGSRPPPLIPHSHGRYNGPSWSSRGSKLIKSWIIPVSPAQPW